MSKPQQTQLRNSREIHACTVNFQVAAIGSVLNSEPSFKGIGWMIGVIRVSCAFLFSKGRPAFNLHRNLLGYVLTSIHPSIYLRLITYVAIKSSLPGLLSPSVAIFTSQVLICCYFDVLRWTIGRKSCVFIRRLFRLLWVFWEWKICSLVVGLKSRKSERN